MTKCEDLIKLDAFVSSNLLQVFTLKPMMMLPEDTSSSIVAKSARIKTLAKLWKAFQWFTEQQTRKGLKLNQINLEALGCSTKLEEFSSLG